MTNYLISIVIPVYNAELYIKKCIDSCILQTYSNIEIIIVNDYSTDNTLNIINSFNDSRIHIINNKINYNSMIARLIGFKHAKGDYILSLDADDTLEYTACFQLNTLLNKSQYDIIQLNFNLTDCYNNTISQIPTYFLNISNSPLDTNFKTTNEFVHSLIGKCIKSNIIKKNIKLLINEFKQCNIGLYEDLITFLFILKYAKTSYFIDIKLYNYTIGTGISTTVPNIYKFITNLNAIADKCTFFKDELNVDIGTNLNLYTYLSNHITVSFAYFVINNINNINSDHNSLLNLSNNIFNLIQCNRFIDIIIQNFQNTQLNNYSVLFKFLKNAPINTCCRSKSNNILICYKSLGIGGIETYIYTLIPILYKYKFNIFLLLETNFQFDSGYYKYIKQIITVPSIPYSNSPDVMNTIRYRMNLIQNAIDKYQINIFYNNNYANWYSFFDLLAAKSKLIYCVLHYHTNGCVPIFEKWTNIYRQWYYTYISSYNKVIVLKQVDEILFNSLGINAIYIPNIIGPKLKQQITMLPYIKNLGITNKRLKCIWVGRNSSEKKPNLIFNIIKQFYTLIDFIIIHDRYDDNYNKFFSQYNVTYYWNKDKKFIYQQYSQANILLYTSEYDGYPYSVLEALAYNLIVIASVQFEQELFKFPSVIITNDINAQLQNILINGINYSHIRQTKQMLALRYNSFNIENMIINTLSNISDVNVCNYSTNDYIKTLNYIVNTLTTTITY